MFELSDIQSIFQYANTPLYPSNPVDTGVIFKVDNTLYGFTSSNPNYQYEYRIR